MYIEDVYKYTQKMDTEIHRRWIQRRQILTNLIEARQVLYTCQVMLQFQLLSTNDFLYQFQLVYEQISYYYQYSYQYSTQVIEAWSACHTGMFVHNRLSHSLFSHIEAGVYYFVHLINFPPLQQGQVKLHVGQILYSCRGIHDGDTETAVIK